jgi:hypothetical protein
MAYPILATMVNKIQYKNLAGKKVRFQGRIVTVGIHCSRNQSGSWSRGFKFSKREYGMLVHETLRKVKEYSLNHGASWHSSIKEAKKSKGKVILSQEIRGEFAFNAIQKLNREYEGPGYRWRP